MKRSFPATAGLVATLLSVSVLAGCQQAAPGQTGQTAQNAQPQTAPSPLAANDCGKLTPDELAPLLGKDKTSGQTIPPDQLKPSVTAGADGKSWICSYGQSVKTSFTVTVYASAADADAAMKTYRQAQDDLDKTLDQSLYPKGSYSDIGGLADDALRSEVNASLMVRKGNVTLFIAMPADKIMQINIADTFLKKIQ